MAIERNGLLFQHSDPKNMQSKISQVWKITYDFIYMDYQKSQIYRQQICSCLEVGVTTHEQEGTLSCDGSSLKSLKYAIIG